MPKDIESTTRVVITIEARVRDNWLTKVGQKYLLKWLLTKYDDKIDLLKIGVKKNPSKKYESRNLFVWKKGKDMKGMFK